MTCFLGFLGGDCLGVFWRGFWGHFGVDGPCGWQTRLGLWKAILGGPSLFAPKRPHPPLHPETLKSELLKPYPKP